KNGCQHANTRTHTPNPRRAYEHRFQRFAPQLGLGLGNKSVNLSAIAVSLDVYVDQPERRLVRVVNCAGEQNGPGAGTKHRPGPGEFPNRRGESFFGDELEDCRALTAWDNQAVGRFEIKRASNLNGPNAKPLQHTRVRGKVPL